MADGGMKGEEDLDAGGLLETKRDQRQREQLLPLRPEEVPSRVRGQAEGAGERRLEPGQVAFARMGEKSVGILGTEARGEGRAAGRGEIGRAHVRTPVTPI